MNLEGKTTTKTSNKKITFLVDSRATEHIVNKGFILQNFEKCSGAVIKSANKEKSADIQIDGKGDLYLNKVDQEGYPIKLTDVLAAQKVSENSLSLRHFADAGFCVYFDDSTIKIYDKKSEFECLTGYYRKPNWLINLEIKDLEDKLENSSYHKYTCRARLVNLEKLPSRPQENGLENEIVDDEVGREPDLENLCPKFSQYYYYY